MTGALAMRGLSTGSCCAYCQGVLDPDRFGDALYAIQFAPTEIALIRALSAAKGSVVPSERLVNTLQTTPAGLGVLVNKLRIKMATADYSIRNDRGVGYSLHRVRHPSTDITAAYRIIRVR